MSTRAGDGFCAHARPRLPGNDAGPLRGLSFAVKDVFAVRGVAACYGNPHWLATHGPAAEHAAVIERLTNAGASLAGVTLTDELGLSLTGENGHYGTPANPAAPGRVPGGSSSGSAVVVARDDVDFALGTDTGGSVRVPASHCGVLGLRPTHGAIVSRGVLPLAPRFDTVGLFARRPGVLERVGRVLLSDERATLPRRLVALELEPLCSAAAWVAFEKAAVRLSEALAVPLAWEALEDAPELDAWCTSYLTLQNLEAAALHRAWLERVKPTFGSLIARRIGWMLATPASHREAAEHSRRALAEALARCLGSDAWLVLPSAPDAAPGIGGSDDAVEAYTGRALTLAAPASMAGLPQLSLPLARVNGAPFGVSLIGPARADRALLRAAAQVEAWLDPLPGDPS